MYINEDFNEEYPVVDDEWVNPYDPLPTIEPPINWDDRLDPDPSVITLPEDPSGRIDWDDRLDPDPNGPSLPPGVPLTAVYDEEKGVWRNIDDEGSSSEYDSKGKLIDSYDKDGKVIVGTGVDTKTGYQPGSIQVKNPDGTITSKNSNGSTVTFKPDGSILSKTSPSEKGLLDYITSLNAKDATSLLKNAFTGTSTVAPAIGAIIGMLNRTKGDEGTRGLKDAPKPYVANRQQITSPVGAATGQGQQYFSPTTFTDTPQPQNLPVKTTGGGIEGLRPQPTPTGFPLGYNPYAPQPPRPAPWEVLYDIPPQEPKPEEPSLVSEVGRPDYEYYKTIAQPQIGPKPEPAPPPPPPPPPQEFEMVPGPNGLIKMPKLPPGMAYAEGGLAGIPMQDPVSMYAYGGLSDLGGYTHAAGGRMLKGPGDGMSDSIPASIAGKQPARLATDEFVIPADVVSHLGNGSSDAGAKVLYDMMARVRKARTGKAMQGKKINPQKLMPR
jgi:hypothetical protein